jgi:hypothetical protein
VRGREIAISAGRTVLAAGAAVVVARRLAGAVAGGQGALALALPGLVGVGSFAVTFLLFAWGLRSDELVLVASPLLRRLRKKPEA